MTLTASADPAWNENAMTTTMSAAVPAPRRGGVAPAGSSSSG